MCNAAGTDSLPAPAPPLGSLKASAHQLLHPVDGDQANAHALQLSKVYTLPRRRRTRVTVHILPPEAKLLRR
jgi:hypothetical protein